MDALGRLLALGLMASGIALLFRALPWPRHWLKVKPWSCSVCLGGHGAWMAMALQGTWPGWRMAAVSYFGATAVAAIICRYLFPPPLDFGEGPTGPLDGGSDEADAENLSAGQQPPLARAR